MAEVLNKAFTLLKLLKPKREQSEWSASELARITGYNVGTTHRILQIMQEHGLIYQNKQNKKFRLGFALVEYGFLARNLYSIRDLARPFMEELADSTNETIYLNVLLEDQAVLIDSVDSNHYLRISEPIGLRLPLHVGASRRVILAYMDTKKQEELIRQLTWKPRTEKTITQENQLRREMGKMKELGYAISFGETTIGTAGVASPVFGTNGVEASLSIAGPEVRFDNSRIPFFVEQITEKANRLSQILGGQEWLAKTIKE